ncbi:MAG: prepilin-type N-terminal cleavage/methylation domain-containing protein [Endomicrobiaceae bacterium]|nr:prepilin-type N-terminal cleavage/methylation domain-containing protein [Endomicrobiaceae bacterium]
MERHWHKITNKKAFTLVELVIVIVIVGILSTISVSAYSSLSLKAIEAEGASLVGFIVNNEVTYQIENGDFWNVPTPVKQSDVIGVDLNISKYFQTFEATVSTDDEGEDFVFVVLKGTYKGTDITMSLGRSASGYMTDILKGEDATNVSLAKSICQQKRNRHREQNNNGKDNGGNGNNDKSDDPSDDNSQGQGTGNGNGNNGNGNGNGNNGNGNG